MSLKIGEIIVQVSNSLDLDETASPGLENSEICYLSFDIDKEAEQ